jgi:hypothetical protein
MAAEPAREAQPADEEQFDVEGSRKEAVKLIESMCFSTNETGAAR